MGNIKSFCCRDNASEVDDREERSRILNDTNCASSTDLYNNSSNSALDTVSYGSINGNGTSSKTMEQSALDRIYQKMAANVIDVAPGESMVIQPAEFMERQKAYQAKLNQIKTPLPLRVNNRVAKNLNASIDASRINTTHYLHHHIPSASPSSNNVIMNSNSNSNISTNNATNVEHNASATNTTTISSNLFTNNVITTTATNSQSLQSGSLINITSNNSPQHIGKSQEKRRVEYEPISVDEIQLINEISARTAQAIKGLKINSQEQVITHFQP